MDVPVLAAHMFAFYFGIVADVTPPVALAAANDVPLTLIQVDSLQKAKELPGVFNNWGVFYKGKFETVNVLDTTYLKRILKK